MPAYFLFDLLGVNDPKKMDEYQRRVVPTLEQYGGRHVVVGGKSYLVEGDWRPVFPVIIEFPDLEQAYRWYSSEEYKELKELRLSASESNAIIIGNV